VGALPSAARRTARKANGILSGSDHDETGAPRDLPGASSERVRAAWRFAERAHRGTTRRDGVTPYVDHAVAVAREVVAAHGGDDVVCAAYLHDVVEHEHVPLVEVATGFGDRVAALVGAVTDEPQDEGGRLRAWLEQKQVAVGALRRADDDVVLLRAADLCANVDDLVAGHDAVGRAVWQRYEAGAAQQSGYYVALADEVLARLPAGAMRERVEACLRALREVMAADGVRPRGRFRNAGSRAARA
jgi:(p)ppGpp synthase/HD superfamily hydrolase